MKTICKQISQLVHLGMQFLITVLNFFYNGWEYVRWLWGDYNTPCLLLRNKEKENPSLSTTNVPRFVLLFSQTFITFCIKSQVYMIVEYVDEMIYWLHTRYILQT